MGYQVLARKWRPQNFSQLVGQEHVVTAISNALDNDRLHHAYLFTGTRGVGKTTIARIFSKSLNCETGISSTPCGICATCQEIDQGNFIDLLEIDAASRTKVEDTRELLDNVQYKPTRGKYKVYLIDEVHMLSKHSFNALLKTLEEPPPHVKFLLATTDPQKLPVTILSRCLQFNLKAMSREQISGQLNHILNEEGLAFESEALSQLARAANGSMRDALSLTDQAIAQGNGEVSLSVVTDMLGLMDKNQVLKLLKALLEGQSNEAMSQLDHLVSQSIDYSQLLAELLSLLHQIALTQLVPEVCKLETIAARAIYHLAGAVAPEQVQLLYQIVLQGRKDLPYAMDGRSGVEMILLRMLAFNPERKVTSAQFIAENQPDIKADPPVDDSIPEDLPEPAELQQAENQQQEILQQAEAMQIAQENAPHSASEPDEQHQPHNPESTPLAESSSLSQTESLLALRRGLRQSSEEENEVKKSEAVEPAFEPLTTDLPLTPDKQPQAESGNEPPPPLSELADSDPDVNNNIPPWALAANEARNHEPPAGQDEVSDEFDVQELLKQIDTVPVSIELPTFLASGEKVTHARQLDEWSELIEQTGIGGLTKQLALQSSMQRNNNQCKLTLPESLQHLSNDAARTQLQQVLSELWQQPMELQVELGEPINPPFAIQQGINKMRQQYAQDVISNDTNVNYFRQEFDAQIIENSIEPR